MLVGGARSRSRKTPKQGVARRAYLWCAIITLVQLGSGTAVMDEVQYRHEDRFGRGLLGSAAGLGIRMISRSCEEG